VCDDDLVGKVRGKTASLDGSVGCQRRVARPSIEACDVVYRFSMADEEETGHGTPVPTGELNMVMMKGIEEICWRAENLCEWMTG
jgi:hypothetical protein